MARESIDKASETEVIAFVSTGAKEADFEALCTGCYLQATQDCYIEFDGVANANSFLIKASEFCHLEKVNFTRISALAVSTGGNLHILATRVSN